MKNKIIIFCCQEIGYLFIKHLIKNKLYNLVMVVSYETVYDTLYGYKYNIKNLCKKSNISYLDQKKITNNLIRKIKKIEPHYIFSVYSRTIFTDELLSIPTNGCINIHPSLLPKYKGPVPTAWALLNNENYIGVTIHKMVSKIDDGPIMFQKKVKIFNKENGFQLHKRVMNESLKFLKINFKKILLNKFILKKQIGNGSYFGKLDISNKINWKSKIIDIHNLVRVYSEPYSSCQSKLLNRTIFINKTVILNNNHNNNFYHTGQIIKITPKKEIIVNCNDGILKIVDYIIHPKFNKYQEKIILRKGNILE